MDAESYHDDILLQMRIHSILPEHPGNPPYAAAKQNSLAGCARVGGGNSDYSHGPQLPITMSRSDTFWKITRGLG